jgi:hypothetical protein
MAIKQIGRLGIVGVLAGLCLAVGQTPAGAATRTPQQAEFYRAVVTCEQRTAPSALRGCVYQLTTPDAQQESIFDLWHIFTDCLAFADAAWRDNLDQMYPPEESYEDLVNGCLGL